jgi:hypothetical protein
MANRVVSLVGYSTESTYWYTTHNIVPDEAR